MHTAKEQLADKILMRVSTMLCHPMAKRIGKALELFLHQKTMTISLNQFSHLALKRGGVRGGKCSTKDLLQFLEDLDFFQSRAELGVFNGKVVTNSLSRRQ